MNWFRKTMINGLFIIIAGCISTGDMKKSKSSGKYSPIPQIPARAELPTFPSNASNQDIILAAERKAITPQGRNTLIMGRKMTLINKEIIPGGCWDYANEVYNRAGYPNQARKRKTIFKSAKKGPYADISLIQAGDFLYYINHSYGDIEHSAIFIDWVDYNNKQALMLSYAGENRREPARYRSYDLSSVYRIIRATN